MARVLVIQVVGPPDVLLQSKLKPVKTQQNLRLLLCLPLERATIGELIGMVEDSFTELHLVCTAVNAMPS